MSTTDGSVACDTSSMMSTSNFHVSLLTCLLCSDNGAIMLAISPPEEFRVMAKTSTRGRMSASLSCLLHPCLLSAIKEHHVLYLLVSAVPDACVHVSNAYWSFELDVK